jgi:hypothetical protein
MMKGEIKQEKEFETSVAQEVWRSTLREQEILVKRNPTVNSWII